MEVVRLSGYILDEKMQIANQYLIPAAKKQMGLEERTMQLPDDAIASLIRWYCREAGVRNLQKHVERICRKVALKVVQASQAAQAAEAQAAEAAEETGATGSAAPEGAAEGAAAAAAEPPVYVIGPDELVDYVGKPKFIDERIYATNPVGVVTGRTHSTHSSHSTVVRLQRRSPNAGSRGPRWAGRCCTWRLCRSGRPAALTRAQRPAGARERGAVAAAAAVVAAAGGPCCGRRASWVM